MFVYVVPENVSEYVKMCQTTQVGWLRKEIWKISGMMISRLRWIRNKMCLPGSHNNKSKLIIFSNKYIHQKVIDLVVVLHNIYIYVFWVNS